MAEEKVEPTLNRKILNQETQAQIMSHLTQIFDDMYVVNDNLKKESHNLALGDISNAIKSLEKNKNLFEQNQTLENPFTTRIALDNGVDSFTTADGILGFIAAQRPLIEEMYLLFKEADDELKDPLEVLGLALYGNHWDPKPKPKAEETVEEETDSTVSLYKENTGELAIRFRNKKARNDFYETLPKGTIPQNFIKPDNKQFEKNKEGATPICHEADSNVLHYPSYQAANKEFAINCANKDNRDMLIAMLNLRKTEENEERTIYAGLFAAYHNEHQETALYFNKENKVFAESGKTYLRINITTGEITQHEFKSHVEENIAVEEKEVEHKEAKKAEAQIPEGKEEKEEKKEKKDSVSEALQDDACILQVKSHIENNVDGYQLEIKFARDYICDFWFTALTNQFKIPGVVDISEKIQKTDSSTVVIHMATRIGEPGIYFKSLGEQFFSKSPLVVNLKSRDLIDFLVDSLNLPKEIYTKSTTQPCLLIPLNKLSGGLKSSVNLNFIQEALVVEPDNLGPRM